MTSLQCGSERTPSNEQCTLAVTKKKLVNMKVHKNPVDMDLPQPIGEQEKPEYLKQPRKFDNLKFTLECFVLSFGPEFPQLGRYHPSSDPEKFVEKLEPHSPPIMKDMPFPDDYILRELSEARALLERLLEVRDVTDMDHDLLDLLLMLPEMPLGAAVKEPLPHYPVGDWGFIECGVCCESCWLYRRICCDFAVCSDCLKQYFTDRVKNGVVQIECVNTECHSYVHRDEIVARLTPAMKDVFYKLLIRANENDNSKTCPKCNHLTILDKFSGKKSKKSANNKVECKACYLSWCFYCHAPWHEGMTCNQFRKGDQMLKSWAKEVRFGQVNAQKCPKCKIYIQRTTGCDHMHCSSCKTDFCYQCGDRFRRLKFLGDHYSRLSIFGCKYRYKADKPFKRKLVRGALLGSKVMAAPALGLLALCAGVMAVGMGVFVLPLWGGVRLLRCYKARQEAALKGLPTLLRYNNLGPCNI